MTENHNNLPSAVRLTLDWLAAFLGIGTVAGLVNLGVGVLSACWLAYQLWVAIKYDLPLKRAKLEAALRGDIATKPGDLK